MVFRVEDITVAIGEKTIIDKMSFQMKKGQLIGLIGPNGSGKSTLLKSMYRYLKPKKGHIYLFEQDVWKQNEKQVAKRMAVVGQETPVLFEFTVRDLVAMGRTPHKKLFEMDNKEDSHIVQQALEQTNMIHLADRQFSTLSGGEKKRVVVARALAQQAQVLVLDEPTNHLDIQHQLQLMDLIRGLPITVIAALHDLNLAATYCDSIYVLKDGLLCAEGTPEEVLTPNLIKQVFHVKAEVSTHPLTKKPQLFFLSEQWD